jgi:hypothetical protein
VDSNGNGFPEDTERVNGIRVLMSAANGSEQTATTANGEVVFDMTGYPIGIGVTISLPDYYRNEWLVLPAEGELLVIFSFSGPPFPTALP